MLEQMMRMIVGEQIGSYHLDKFIGVGGFGGVFEASERVRNVVVKKVALKIIPDNSDEQLLELLAARELDHFNLVRSYNAGECDILKMKMLYLAMELAQGSLDKRIEKGKVSTDEVRLVTQQVAQGLSYLHSKNKVHRDLKPANILTVENQWKLSDFGLIRQLNSQSYIKTMNVGGTIAYMPPEAFGGEISSAWDLWSLGILLVEMISGQLPYEFNDFNHLLVKVTNGELTLPRLPKEFEPIILGCLQKDRRKRGASRFCKNINQHNDSPRVSAPLKKANVQNWDAPRKRWTAQQVLKGLESQVKVSPQVTIPSIPQPRKPLQNFTETLPNGVKLEMISR